MDCTVSRVHRRACLRNYKKLQCSGGPSCNALGFFRQRCNKFTEKWQLTTRSAGAQRLKRWSGCCSWRRRGPTGSRTFRSMAQPVQKYEFNIRIFFPLHLLATFHLRDFHIITALDYSWLELKQAAKLLQNIFVDAYPTLRRPSTTMEWAQRSNCIQHLME